MRRGSGYKYIAYGFLQLVLLFAPGWVISQISVRKVPASFLHPELSPAIPVITAIPSNEEIDKVKQNKTSNLKSLTYAFEIKTSITTDNYGKWDILPDGSKIWRVAISSPDAISIHLFFSKLHLPDNACLFVYDSKKTQVLGAFTNKTINPSEKLATAEIFDVNIIVEYNEPETVNTNLQFEISKVYHAFNDFRSYKDGRFGKSGSCNVDVVCPEGEGWQEEKHAVCRIGIGSSICTGVLLNNAKNDGTPYFLTAQHCILGSWDYSEWIFYFNYESPDCNGSDGSVSQTISGCELKATCDTLDFCLVELSSVPPAEFQPFYSGWNRSTTPNLAAATCIHHPQGDVKKITKDFNAPVTGTYNAGEFGVNAHWKINNWEMGTTEKGSSGSPLFDQDGKVIGVLTGGDANCSYNVNDYFSKFSIYWDRLNAPSGQLKYWLDPDTTDIIILNAFDPTHLGDGCDSTTNFKGQPAIYFVPTGGYLSGNNAYGDKVKAEFFNNENREVEISMTYFNFSIAKGGSTPIQFKVWEDNNGMPGAVKGSTQIGLDSISNDVASNNLTKVVFSPPIVVSGSFYVGAELPSETGDTLVIVTDREENVSSNTAWEQSADNTWFSYKDSWGISLNHDISVVYCTYTSTKNGIDEDLDSDIWLYPNPGEGLFQLSFSDGINPENVLIFNAIGNQVIPINLNKNQHGIEIDISNFARGIYFLKCQVNQRLVTKKIILIN